MLILSGIKVINLGDGGQNDEMGRAEEEPYSVGLELEIAISTNCYRVQALLTCAAQQANKLRGELLGQEKVT